ncbi:MAG: hypothetical protein HFE45_00325 [Oscillospiraceae bacterium]|jgi:hypothetical protein|nr:hypothetical protein [Oscillospiraceae bacterium]
MPQKKSVPRPAPRTGQKSRFKVAGGSKNIYDINAYRRRKQMQKLSRRLAAMAAALTVVAAAFAGLYFYQNYDLNNLAETARAGGTRLETGGGFPISMDGVNPSGLRRVGDCVALLTSEETVFFKDTSALHSFTHQFTNPVTRTAAGRLLSYDRGGYGFRIDSEKGLHYSARTESTILTGAISRKLGYALALSEVRYAASVAVYDRGNKELLHWYSVSDSVIDMDFSYDGNRLAAAAIGFENGDLVGKVYILNLGGGEETVYSFPGVLPLAVDYKRNGSIHLICDTVVGVISPKGELSQVPLAGPLSDYYFTDNATVMLASESGDISFSLIQVDDDGQSQSVQVRGSSLDVVADGESIYVLEKNSVQRFDRSLELLEQQAVGSDVFAIESSGRGAYLLSANYLDRWTYSP